MPKSKTSNSKTNTNFTGGFCLNAAFKVKFQLGKWRSSDRRKGEKLGQEWIMLAGGNTKALCYFFRYDEHRSFNC